MRQPPRAAGAPRHGRSVRGGNCAERRMLPGIHRQADRREGRQDRGRDDENAVVASHGIRSVFGSRAGAFPTGSVLGPVCAATPVNYGAATIRATRRWPVDQTPIIRCRSRYCRAS